jgi:hypothetical protein
MKKYKPHKYWTKSRVFAQAKKYGTSYDWRTNSPSSYSVAIKNKWINEIREKKLIEEKKIISKNDIIQIARKYKTKKDFRRFDKSVYDYACKKGWLKECSLHFEKTKRTKTIWSIKLILTEIKKYKTWHDILQDERLSSAIYRFEMVDRVKTIKKYTKELKWSEQNLILEAKKFQTKKDLMNHNPTILRIIYEKGLESKCFDHMAKYKEELDKKEILSAIKQSKTKQNKIGNVYSLSKGVCINEKKKIQFRPSF